MTNLKEEQKEKIENGKNQKQKIPGKKSRKRKKTKLFVLILIIPVLFFVILYTSCATGVPFPGRLSISLFIGRHFPGFMARPVVKQISRMDNIVITDEINYYLDSEDPVDNAYANLLMINLYRTANLPGTLYNTLFEQFGFEITFIDFKGKEVKEIGIDLINKRKEKIIRVNFKAPDLSPYTREKSPHYLLPSTPFQRSWESSILVVKRENQKKPVKFIYQDYVSVTGAVPSYHFKVEYQDRDAYEFWFKKYRAEHDRKRPVINNYIFKDKGKYTIHLEVTMAYREGKMSPTDTVLPLKSNKLKVRIPAYEK